MTDPKSVHMGTKVIHAGQRPDPVTGAVMPPISVASTYVQSSPGVHTGFEYSRTHNPTRYALERMVALLEGSPLTARDDVTCGGFAFASGMASISVVLDLLASGDHVVSMDDLYGGTRRLMTRVREKSAGLNVDYADLSNLANLERALRADTKLVWVETPTNPTLKVADLRAVGAMTRKKAPGAILACDNTFCSPINQRPFEHGFDMVMHSTTKYLNGHSDSVGGLVVVRTKELAEKMRFTQNAVGAILSPFDSYLTLRGIKTLALRMARHNENGMLVARWCERHAAIDRVVYPGLPSHPHHEVARRQMEGFGGMVTIFLKGGVEAARKMLERVRIFALAESLGGVESLIEHPGIMTHSSVPADARDALGISDSMVRLSVGIEDPDDLIKDLEQALAGLDAASAPKGATRGKVGAGR